VYRVAVLTLQAQKVRGRIERDKKKRCILSRLLPKSDNILDYLYCDLPALKAFQVL